MLVFLSRAQYITEPTLAQLMSAIDLPSVRATACRAKETFCKPSSKISRACSSWFLGFTLSRDELSMEVRLTPCWLPSRSTPRSDMEESFTGDLSSASGNIYSDKSTKLGYNGKKYSYHCFFYCKRPICYKNAFLNLKIIADDVLIF